SYRAGQNVFWESWIDAAAELVPDRDELVEVLRVSSVTIGQTDFSPLGGKRSQVTGPPLRQLDLGVAKQIKWSSQRQFEIRAEVFNLTNTAAFNLPGSLNFLDARNFASITSMRNTPRQIQLGAKIHW